MPDVGETVQFAGMEGYAMRVSKMANFDADQSVAGLPGLLFHAL